MYRVCGFLFLGYKNVLGNQGVELRVGRIRLGDDGRNCRRNQIKR